MVFLNVVCKYKYWVFRTCKFDYTYVILSESIFPILFFYLTQRTTTISKKKWFICGNGLCLLVYLAQVCIFVNLLFQICLILKCKALKCWLLSVPRDLLSEFIFLKCIFNIICGLDHGVTEAKKKIFSQIITIWSIVYDDLIFFI